MNRGQSAPLNRPVTTIVIIVLIGKLLAAAPLRAQQITQQMKTASSVTDVQAQIDATVKKDVAALAGGNAGARNTLINYAQVPGGTASAAFLDAYAVSLNTHLQPLAKDANLAVRLNGAIVAAQVAQVANNPRLADAANAFVNDKADAVVYWGLRAADHVVPNLLKPPFANPKHPLIPSIINAVKTHNEGIASGWIATEAYNALTLDLNPAGGKQRPTAQMIAATIDPVQSLLRVRVDQYKLGVPAMPTAEQIATGYLSNPVVWPVQAPAQQQTSLQLFSDLLSLATQQASAPEVNPTDLRDLLSVIRLVGSALAVNAPPGSLLDAAAKQVMGVGPTTPVNDVVKRVALIPPALSKLPGMKINPPPKIEGHKPAPAPATAPTTLPTGAAPVPIPPPPPVQEFPQAPPPGGAGPGAGGPNRPPPTPK